MPASLLLLAARAAGLPVLAGDGRTEAGGEVQADADAGVVAAAGGGDGAAGSGSSRGAAAARRGAGGGARLQALRRILDGGRALLERRGAGCGAAGGAAARGDDAGEPA